ncbi:MAG TPA: glycosyltransferase [Planctomycetes bacterium]|nr:glycosyltransferase [Planctomycetota bacterium]
MDSRSRTSDRPSAIHAEERRISVVVPTWNGGPRFRELLVALASQNIEDGIELLVVDSGSTDGTVAAARAAGARVLEIPKDTFQHGRTRNLGISETSGEIVCLLTQDAIPIGPDYIANLVGPYRSANVDGVYARQYPRPDCDPILRERLRRWSASRDTPTLSVLAPGDPEASRALFERLPPIERYLTSCFDDVASSVRRSTWERIPYPERDFGEDVAWAREVLLAGGAIAFEPSAEVEHSHNLQLLREFRRLYMDHANLRELFDLRTVPSWRAVRSGWRGQVRVYRDLLDAQPLGPLERLRWRLVSLAHAFLEGAAQYLGARDPAEIQASLLSRRLDRWVRANA